MREYQLRLLYSTATGITFIAVYRYSTVSQSATEVTEPVTPPIPIYQREATPVLVVELPTGVSDTISIGL